MVLHHCKTIGTKAENVQVQKIGNGVDIGSSSVILRDISLGDGSVIGAGGVVIKSVRANSIVAGNPARVLHRSTSVSGADADT